MEDGTSGCSHPPSKTGPECELKRALLLRMWISSCCSYESYE